MNTVEIIFSPTGGTSKVAHIIGSCWSHDPVVIDLSRPDMAPAKYAIAKDDRVLIAMPSFGGRAPAEAIRRLQQIHGNGAKCTLVCVYGNRAYEDTLVEMEDAANTCGFQVTAAIAAVAEHSILPQYATHRPDAADKAQLEQFAAQIADRQDIAVSIPGNRPYKTAGGGGLVPKTGKGCTACGLCAKVCPVQAIDPATFKTDPQKCISCMRCVRQCPEKDRKVNGLLVSIAGLAIKKACSVRKENQLFL